MPIKRLNDAAISDVMGFLLILTILLVSLGIISIVAQPVLEKSREDLYFSNMEQTFVLLHSDTNDIASGKSTITTRDINLVNDPLTFNPNSSQITVLTRTYNPINITFKAGSLEYEINGLKVSLENGALISSYGTGSLIIKDPVIYTTRDSDGNLTIINLIRFDGTAFSTGGKGIVRIIQQKNFSESYVSQQQNVSIRVNSRYADGWAHYFEKQGYVVTTLSPNVIQADINNTRVRIIGTAIGLSYAKPQSIQRPEYALDAKITTPSGGMGQPTILINATITNTGNQDMRDITARLDYKSDFTWNINHTATPQVRNIGTISAGASKGIYWNVSTDVYASNNIAYFYVTVVGQGNSSWINPAQYQTGSNKIWILRD